MNIEGRQEGLLEFESKTTEARASPEAEAKERERACQGEDERTLVAIVERDEGHRPPF